MASPCSCSTCGGCARVLLAVPSGIGDEVVALGADAEVLGVDTASQAETRAASLQRIGYLDPLERVLVTSVDLRPLRLETLRALLACDADAVEPPPLKETLAAVRVAVEVDDPAVLGDFDRPEDLPSR